MKKKVDPPELHPSQQWLSEAQGTAKPHAP